MEIIKTDKFTTLKADKGKVLKNGETTACVVTLKGDYSKWIEVDASTLPVDPELLVEAKEKKIREIDAYNDSDSVNGFFINGAKVWVDAETRVRGVNGAKAKQTLGATTMSQWLGGQEYTLSPDMAVMLYAQIESYALDCQNVTEAHKAAVLALNTVEEVEAYDITQGYPEMLSFTI